jgi:hypothetical protein
MQCLQSESIISAVSLNYMILILDDGFTTMAAQCNEAWFL